MFSSTIVPTVGRPTLAHAVASVLDQDVAHDFEIVVVNDSGAPLPPEPWQTSPRVRVVATNRHERSFARNAGAAAARGRYLHFLDDDDLLLPGALEAFASLADREPSAAWLSAAWETVDNAGRRVDAFHPHLTGNIFALLVAGEGLPMQACLVRADAFFGAGGYDPAPILTGVEDRDLGRRLALTGSIAYTDVLAARIRIGEVNSTTNWLTIAEGDRHGREKALSAPASFGRMWTSAATGYWRGRATRAYVASGARNFRRLRLATATGRLACAASLAAWYPLTAGFWRGLTTKVR